MNVLVQQGVAIGSLDLSDDILVIFAALQHDVTVSAVHGDGAENGAVSFICNMAGDVVNALSFVQLGSDPILVGGIVDHEFHMVIHTGFLSGLSVGVREQLAQINTKAVNMAIVDQSVIEIGAGTLPGQDNLVVIAVLTVDEGGIGVDGCSVGDAHGVVGVTGIQLAVDVLGIAVDLSQTCGGDVDGHVTVIIGIVDGEFAILLVPGSNLISAALVGEELDLNVLQILVVGQTFADGIVEIVGGQSGSLGGDGGQAGQNLVFHHVTGRTGSIVGETIGDDGRAVILAGVLACLTDFLGQFGDAGLILGVNGHIVIPLMTAFGRGGVLIAGNGGHGQGYEERSGGAGDGFTGLSFQNQPQAGIEALNLCLAVFIGQIHGNSAVAGCDIAFQSVLDGGVIFSNGICQSLVQHIGGVVIVVGVQLVGGICVLIAVCTVFQADGLQKISRSSLVKSIQNLGHVVFGMIVIGGLCKGHNVGNPQQGKFHTLQSVAIGGLTVAQGAAAAQDGFHIAFLPAGGGEGFIVPDTILHGVGPVILEDGQRAVVFMVDGGIRNFGGRDREDGREAHDQCQTQGDSLHKLVFHGDVSFQNQMLFSDREKFGQ